MDLTNIQQKKVNCMHAHVVTQEYLVTLLDTTHTTPCKSKEKQKYKGPYFMLCHRVTSKGQLSLEFQWPHFSRDGNDLPPCPCHTSTTVCPWCHEVLPPRHTFNFCCISNLLPKLRCTSCFRKGNIIFGHLSWNSLSGQSLRPTLSVTMLELVPIKQMVNRRYRPDSYNKFYF